MPARTYGLRLPRQSGLVLVRPQEPEQAPNVGERLPTCLLDREQRPAGPRRVLLEEKPGGAGLYGHDADAVRDHVVEVASDAGAFGGDCSTRPFLALVLERGGPLLELDGAVRSAPEREGGCREPAYDEQKADDAEVGVGVGDDELEPMTPTHGNNARQADRRACDRLLPLVVAAQKPEGEREREGGEGRQDLAFGGSPGIGDGDTHEHGEDEDRRPEGEAAPQEQREGC